MTRTIYRAAAVAAPVTDGVVAGRAMAILGLLGALTLTVAGSLDAQDRGRGDQDRGRDGQGIPPGHLPPPGECRVWYDNRPPGQQSPPTSCANARTTAIRNGGRVIYGGDAARRDDRGRDDRGRDDGRRNEDRRGDDRRRGDDCDEKDRRKGECGDGRGRDDGRRDDGRRDEGRYPDRDRTYPRSLPEMVWGVVFGRGERLNEVRQWVGGEPVSATFTDANRDGVPEAVTWTDSAGRIVQRWIDTNRDGRADRVALYQNNKIVRVIE